MAAMTNSKMVPSVFQHVDPIHLIAGVSGGVASTLALHPLDLVKIRLQVNESHSSSTRPQYAGFMDAVTKIWRGGGFRGLYQGVVPNIWGNATSWGLYFFLYNSIKMTMAEGDRKRALSSAQHMAAAAPSGFLTLLATNPIWVTKTRLCLQYEGQSALGSGQSQGMLGTITGIARNEGFRGLYKGLVPGIFGISHGIVQFVTYEKLKQWYLDFYGLALDKRLGTVEYIGCAALSKMVAVTVTYPYQVLRSRLQDQNNKYSGSMAIMRQLLRHEGIAGLYKGLLPNLLRVTPGCCVVFAVYETVISYSRKDSS